MNIYVRITNDSGRRLGGHQIVDECEFYRKSSLHRKWSGSLFTNADKTTSLHFVVFYLRSSRKRRINFRYSILFPSTLTLSSGISFRSFRSFLGTATRRGNPSSHFRRRYALLRLSYLFLLLKPVCLFRNFPLSFIVLVTSLRTRIIFRRQRI